MSRRLILVPVVLVAGLFLRPVRAVGPQADTKSQPAATDVAWDQLGVKLEPVGAADVAPAHRDLRGGMRVVAVRPASPAAGKIREGDVLVGLLQWETTTETAVTYVLDYVRRAGLEVVSFLVVRGDRLRRGEVRLSGAK